MKTGKLFLAAAFVSALSATPAAAQKAEDAFGVWEHPDNGSHIQISQCNGGLCAKVIKVNDPSRKDVHNPDPAKRNRLVQGITIMNGAKKTGDAKWSGKLYNTQDGETYTGSVTVLSRDKLKLEGCVLGGLVCQGPTWTRVN